MYLKRFVALTGARRGPTVGSTTTMVSTTVPDRSSSLGWGGAQAARIGLKGNG